MISAHLDAAQECQWPIQAMPGFHDHQPSNAGRFGHPRQCVEPEGIATLARKSRLRVVPNPKGSCDAHHFGGNEGDLLARFAAGVLVADVASVTVSEVLSRNDVVVVDAHHAAIGVGDDRSMGLGLGLFGGDAVHDAGAQVGHLVSPSVAMNIGPMVLSVNRRFA